jgi:hypothetical protein
MSTFVPFGAQRKESFCAMIVPPHCCRSIGLIFPGKCDENATRLRPLPLFRKV